MRHIEIFSIPHLDCDDAPAAAPGCGARNRLHLAQIAAGKARAEIVRDTRQQRRAKLRAERKTGKRV